ncbi:MAG TPA: hypothetical protein PKJ19_11640 [Flavobacteriales bacterium]|nr:hypothetical protein [Flavobacteriales bacterium]HNU57617.1 hypothetical protein [Flavobacteriales bacterium]
MRLALLGVFGVMALRLLLFKLGRSPEGTEFMLVHFLALVTIVFFSGQRLISQDPATSFPDLVREGFKGAAVYALLFGLFLLGYYRWVEPDHFHLRVEELVARGTADGQPEDVIRPRMEKFFTPFNYASMTFFTLLIVGGFNALAVGLIHHKVLRRIRG